MSDDLFDPASLAMDDVPATEAPSQAQSSPKKTDDAAIEDLFDLGGPGPSPAASHAAPAAPGKSSAHTAAVSPATGAATQPAAVAGAGTLDALLNPVAQPAPAPKKFILLRPVTWVGIAVFINIAFAGFLVYKLEMRSAELTRIIRESGGGNRPNYNPSAHSRDPVEVGHGGDSSEQEGAGATEENGLNSKLNHGVPQHGAGAVGRAGMTPPPLPVAVAPAALKEADVFYSQGLYSRARQKYFEAMLHLPPGPAAREFELMARLGVARCLARELAPEGAAIKTRFIQELAIGEESR